MLIDGTNDIIAAAKPGEVLLKVGDSVGGVCILSLYVYACVDRETLLSCVCKFD